MSKQLNLIPEKPIAGTFKQIRLDEIRDSFIGPEPDAAFVESVSRFGIQQSVEVVEIRGRYDVVDGRRRVKAAIALGLKTIPARVVELGVVSRLTLSILLNEQRSENAASTLDAIEQLLAKGASEREIRDVTGLPKPRFERLMRLRKLHLVARQAMAAGTLSQSVAAKLARLPKEKQAELIESLDGERGDATKRITGKAVDEALHVRSQHAVATLGDDVLTGEDWKAPELDEQLRAKFRECADLVRRSVDMDGELPVDGFWSDVLDRLAHLDALVKDMEAVRA